MEFFKLLLNPHHGYYSYKEASSIGMCILANFFSSDVTDDAVGFKEWALDERYDFTSSNATCLEKEPNSIRVFDGTEKVSAKTRANGITIPLDQFIQLLDDWDNKVWKNKPKEVIVKQENGQFFIETMN